MKTKGIDRRPRLNVGHSAPIGRRAGGPPPIAGHTRVARQPSMCERCGAVYERKTWRAGERTRRTSLVGVGWTLCPACKQVPDQEYFGRIRVMAPLDPERELEVRRRIWNVEQRARHTQPERRTVRIDRTPSGLEILTTSQKLAHRMARELEKAFGGRAHYTWTDREGVLDARWEPPARSTEQAGPEPSARSLERRPRATPRA